VPFNEILLFFNFLINHIYGFIVKIYIKSYDQQVIAKHWFDKYTP